MTIDEINNLLDAGVIPSCADIKSSMVRGKQRKDIMLKRWRLIDKSMRDPDNYPRGMHPARILERDIRALSLIHI